MYTGTVQRKRSGQRRAKSVKHARNRYLELIQVFSIKSIFFKYLKSFSLILIVPITILCIIIAATYASLSDKETNNFTKKVFNNSVSRFETVLTEVSKDFLFLQSTDETTRYLTCSKLFKPNSTFIDADFESLRNVFQRLINSGGSIKSISLYSFDSGYIFSTAQSNYIENIPEPAWHKKHRDTVDSFYLVHDSGADFDTLSFCYNIYIEKELKGILVFDVDSRNLVDMLLNNSGDTFFVTDDGGNVLFSSAASLIGTKRDISAANASESRFTFGKQPCISFSEPLSIKNIYFGYDFNLAEQSVNYRVFPVFVLCIVFAIVLTLILSFYMALQSYKTLYSIISSFHFSLSGKTDRDNELSVIISGIAELAENSRNFENDLTAKVAIVHNAQSLALQSQLNLHFLFNTLNHISLNVMELTDGNNPASKMIALLSSLLRSSLSTTEYITSVKNEIEYAKTYVELELIKHNRNFDVFWEIDDSVMGCETLKMILQPIIENSFTHGIMPLKKEKRGRVNISVYRFGKALCFKVADNGVGIPPEKLKVLQTSLKSDDLPSSKHIGLKNVNCRIHLIYGKEYGCDIDSDTNGTTVIISVPLK